MKNGSSRARVASHFLRAANRTANLWHGPPRRWQDDSLEEEDEEEHEEGHEFEVKVNPLHAGAGGGDVEMAAAGNKRGEAADKRSSWETRFDRQSSAAEEQPTDRGSTKIGGIAWSNEVPTRRSTLATIRKPATAAASLGRGSLDDMALVIDHEGGGRGASSEGL